MSTHPMDEVRVPPMKVGVVGPSGIGKTSILAALLQEARDVLEGTDVQIAPNGDTRQRVDELVRRLRGHIRSRNFSPDHGIQPSNDAFTFLVDLTTPALRDGGVRMEMLDYPGGWLSNPDRPGNAWPRVEAFLSDSDVLLIPIAAGLLMEWRTDRQDATVAEYLRVEEVERVVEFWAKARKKTGNSGALLLLPVRCEAYLNDNGGTRNKYAELEAKVLERYEPVTQRAIAENPLTEVVYCPVDTMGCVELAKINWRSQPVDIRFNIRGKSPSLKPRGAGDVFTFLVGRYLDMVAQLHAARTVDAIQKAEKAVELAERDEGPLGNFFNWLTGEAEQRQRQAAALSTEARARVEAMSALGATLSDVRSKRPCGRLKTVAAGQAGASG